MVAQGKQEGGPELDTESTQESNTGPNRASVHQHLVPCT